MKHSYVLFVLLMLGAGRLGLAQSQLQTQAPAQPAGPTPVQSARLELPLLEYSSEVHVQPLAQDSSVLLLVQQDQVGRRHDTYTLQKYDYRLQQRWHTPVEVPHEFEFRQFCAEGLVAYALFQSDALPSRLLVVAMDGINGQVRNFTFETKLTRQIYDLKALSGNLFVTVLVEEHLTVLLLDLLANRYQLLPSVYEPLPAQLSFLADSTAQRAEFVMSQTNGYKSRLQLKRLSAGGALLHSEFVQAESERGLISAQISPASDSASGRLLAGTYTLRDPRYSQGLFATDLSEAATSAGSRRSLRFYDFTNLKHFFDFMSPSRAARLRQRSNKLRAADRVLRLRYRTLIHDLVPFRGGYVMVAEVYFPHYRYNTYGWGSPYTPYYATNYGFNNFSNRQFDGYRTTHALVCGFDQRGNLLWDNTFVLKDVVRDDLTETVRLQPLPDGRLAMAYLDEEKLHYKIIDGANPSPNDLHVNLQTSAVPTVREKALDTSEEGLLTWYGGRFLAYGYQRVRSEGAASREVFFVNSISFK